MKKRLLIEVLFAAVFIITAIYCVNRHDIAMALVSSFLSGFSIHRIFKWLNWD